MTTSLNERSRTKERATLKERVAELIAPLLAERDQLLAERADLREQVRQIDADLVQLDRLLRPAGYTDQKQTPKKPATTTGRKIGKPNESLRRVVQFVIEQNDPVTNQEVADALGLARNHVGSYLREARVNGWLRQAGKRRSAKGGRETFLYAGLPDSMERLEAALSNGK